LQPSGSPLSCNPLAPAPQQVAQGGVHAGQSDALGIYTRFTPDLHPVRARSKPLEAAASKPIFQAVFLALAGFFAYRAASAYSIQQVCKQRPAGP
jgi:hypothetical protein